MSLERRQFQITLTQSLVRGIAPLHFLADIHLICGTGLIDRGSDLRSVIANTSGFWYSLVA